MKLDKFIKMPVEDLTTPAAGRIVYGASYWIVTADNNVLFYKGYYSPQCNSNKAIVERFSRPADSSIVFIPIAYLPHNCHDYCDC